MSDEVEPRGKPINAPDSMAKYRAMKAEMNEKVRNGEITAIEAKTLINRFGGGLIAHEREHREAALEIGPTIEPMPEI